VVLVCALVDFRLVVSSSVLLARTVWSLLVSAYGFVEMIMMADAVFGLRVAVHFRSV
jgi:hypothetical protein